ncbi:hypothetical protein SAMN04487852_101376 [Prevotella sp. tf2-5]|nr:hypothetical protein SAMN04487852_101376 [Prevotella sp. tf2-5]
MNFAYISAIALLSAGLFAACSSSDDAVLDPKQDITPQKDEVNVNFVFNVSTANEATMRMTAENTQATLTQPFRGITNAYIGVFKQNADGKYVSTSISTEKLYPFGTIIGKNGIDPNAGEESNTPKSRRVVEVSLPTDVNSLMFWGKAIKDGSSIDQGKITMNVSSDLSATSFSLDKIVPETADPTEPHVYVQALKEHEQLMAAALTNIVNSNIANTDVKYGGETHKISLAWSDYVDISGESGSYTITARTNEPIAIKNALGASSDISMRALGDKLAIAYATWNTIRSGELRAGSGTAVSKVIEDLMTVVNSVANAEPVFWEEAAAKTLAKQIKTNVEKFFDSDREYQWKTAGELMTALNVKNETLPTVDEDCNLNNFPANFNLPNGSVILQFDITPKDPGPGFDFAYNYKGAVATYAMGDENGSFNPLNYVYPAELCYFGNSAIRVSDQTKAANYYPDGVTDWDNDDKWTNDWVKDSHVTNTTRSVAMKDNINYGTALLETKVKFGAATLQDNYGALDKRWNNKPEITESNNTIDATADRDHFVLTGVLVGGQEQEVGWNYIAKSTTPGFGNMVYDKVGEIHIPHFDSNSATQSTSAANYTLLWDNWEVKNKGSKQRDVFVALEFVNKGVDFYGQNNLIRSGATFYIVGKLDPDKRPSSLTDVTDAAYAANKSLGITWPTNYALPPYDTDGTTIKERRVFMQDYLTSATFVIGENSLQHALVSVPDLRSGQISLGLSVDLNWRTGLVFNDVILGEQ